MTVITDYTFDPTHNQITLGTAYSATKIEEILSIFNLTTGAEIYDYRQPRKRRAPKNESGMDISLTDGVITYIETAGMQDTDKLQIIISTNVILDGGTAYSDSEYIDGGTA